jgi:hypothetical protein
VTDQKRRKKTNQNVRKEGTHPNEDRKDETTLIVTLTLTLTLTLRKDPQDVVRVTVRVDKARQEKRYKARQEKGKARQGNAREENKTQHTTSHKITKAKARPGRNT